jgi:hypothetical protein
VEAQWLRGRMDKGILDVYLNVDFGYQNQWAGCDWPRIYGDVLSTGA